jgi:hypothetical protein
MKTVPAYITVQGAPLCQFAAGKLMARHGCTCGHRSLADARRAKLELQKHVHTVRVVRGECPA